MNKFGSVLLVAIFPFTGCTYTIDPAQIGPTRIVSGYNLFWAKVCAAEPVADGEKVATFTFTLDEAGKAQNVTLVEKTNDCFAEAARAEIDKWVFAPPEYRGQPMRNANYTMNFFYSEDSATIVVKTNDATGEIESLEVRPSK